MTRDTCAEILTLFETAYSMTLTAEQRRAWWLILSPLTDAAAKAAALDVCRTSVYPPKPADVWTRAMESRQHGVPDAQTTRQRLALLKRGPVQAPTPIRAMLAEIGKPMPVDVGL